MDVLSSGVRKGDRRALAQAITLLESSNPDHSCDADILLASLLPYSGNSIRIGISGVPGVGKSTFIERFGLHVLALQHKLAVLAIDPTSKRSGGSILGDKTRMEELSRHPDAFIRPSPAGIRLGGVGHRSREALIACEAAGYDVIFVETVGVGQSETTVADMTDLFLLLLLPGGGDELQGMKKGIVELADIVLVNKADGAMARAAERAVSDYQNAINMLRPASNDWVVPVRACSSLNGDGIDDAWRLIGEWRNVMQSNGAFEHNRHSQAQAWLWDAVRDRLEMEIRLQLDQSNEMREITKSVADGQLTVSEAAKKIIMRYRVGKAT
ncbi:MAG: methylmalonyl Co-A mutase-associated GTPase MeaB [Rhodospirillaceae bacterium]|nr:methylmalonyl Co-A mutase-associated GTPase MeaB [Rhodospirillaceae bacterium]